MLSDPSGAEPCARPLAGLIVALLSAALWPTAALPQMGHSQPTQCGEPDLACATTVTPAFAADGSLWITWAAAGRISVARSRDAGRTFEPAVRVNRTAEQLDSGTDERPKIAVDAAGRIAVAYAIFKDKAFNGEVRYARSSDGGRSFAPPAPITSDPDSQRFEAIAFDPNGNLFAAWLDKRNRRPARERGENYVGAGLAFAWSKD